MGQSQTFSGFPKGVRGFFKDLKQNNSKAWLDANRDRYDGLLMEPSKQFVAALEAPLKKIAPNIRAEPRVNGSIMRMNRDTRFSKDKTPYKTAIHFIFWEGAGKAKDSPALYMRFDDKNLGLAVGTMGFSPDELVRYRRAVIDDVAGKALVKAISAVTKDGVTTLREPHYKRVPREFDADHPRAELLRHAGLVAGGDRPLPDELFSDPVSHVVAQFKRLRPLQKWLVDNVAG